MVLVPEIALFIIVLGCEINGVFAIAVIQVCIWHHGESLLERFMHVFRLNLDGRIDDLTNLILYFVIVLPLLFTDVSFLLLILIPDFLCQVFVTAAMQISNAILNEGGGVGVIVDVSCLLQCNVMHFADGSNDSSALCATEYLFAFFAHNSMLSIKVRQP